MRILKIVSSWQSRVLAIACLLAVGVLGLVRMDQLSSQAKSHDSVARELMASAQESAPDPLLYDRSCDCRYIALADLKNVSEGGVVIFIRPADLWRETVGGAEDGAFKYYVVDVDVVGCDIPDSKYFIPLWLHKDYLHVKAPGRFEAKHMNFAPAGAYWGANSQDF